MEQPKVEVTTTINSVNITGTEENKNTSKDEIVTRNIEIPEENVAVFTCGDMVMDLQLVSGAMIQITKVPTHAGLEARYRPVRLIGSLGNVDRAEKLIKAVVVLHDAGGFALRHKDDNDLDNSEFALPPRSFRKRFCSSFRKRSHKLPCVPSPSNPPMVNNPQLQPSYNQSSLHLASQAYVISQPPASQQPSGYAESHGLPQPPVSSGYATYQAYSMPQPPAYNQSSGYAEGQAQPPANSQLSGYAASRAFSMPQPPIYNQSSEYTTHAYNQCGRAACQAYGMPQLPPYNQPQPSLYNQPSGYAAGQAYGMPQPLPSSGYAAGQAAYGMPQPRCAACQAYGMPQPPPYNQPQLSLYNQLSGYVAGQAYGMPRPPPYNQSSGYTACYGMPQFPPCN